MTHVSSRLSSSLASLLAPLSGLAVARSLAIAALALVLSVEPSPAQELTLQVQRLKKELKTLQNYVYSQQGQAGGAVTGGQQGGPLVARLELRITQLETQLRGLTGQIEQLGFRIDQVSRKLDGMTNDVYARLQRLEQQSVVPGAGLASPADLQQQGGVAPSQAPEQPAIASLSSATGQQRAQGNQYAAGESGTQVIGSVSANSLETLRQQAAQGTGTQSAAATAAQAQPRATQTASTQQFATAKAQYDHAFGLLSQANYPAAEQALGAFLATHPQDPLAGNAKYWLGETQYVRGPVPRGGCDLRRGLSAIPEQRQGARQPAEAGEIARCPGAGGRCLRHPSRAGAALSQGAGQRPATSPARAPAPVLLLTAGRLSP